MTTNAQGLTFGEWLTAGGIPPSVFGVLPPRMTSLMRDDWTQGLPPYSPEADDLSTPPTHEEALAAPATGYTAGEGVARGHYFYRGKPPALTERPRSKS